MSGQIFISYRREESQWSARSLNDRLCRDFVRRQRVVPPRNARLFAVKRDSALEFVLRHQLFAVIAELVATRDTKVAGLQFEHDVGKNAQLEVTAIDTLYRGTPILFPVTSGHHLSATNDRSMPRIRT